MRGRVAGERTVLLQPSVHVGRVPDDDRRVVAVIFAAPLAVRIGADPRTGVAHELVELPARLLVAVAHMAEEGVELVLVGPERMRARMEHVLLERFAVSQVGGELRRLLLVGAGRRGIRRHRTQDCRDRQRRRAQARSVEPHGRAPSVPDSAVSERRGAGSTDGRSGCCSLSH